MREQNKNLFTEAVGNTFGSDNLRKIQQVTVGIAGAGGLGSNCAVNLVRSGFTKFVIVDFDKIEHSNLNRQFYFYDQVGRPKVEALQENLLRINPALELEIHQVKIDEHNIEALFEYCQIIVEAFDQVLYKKILVEHYASQDKFMVSASGIAGWGKSDELKTHKMMEQLYIVGDLSSQVSEALPPCAPRVAIAAAKQADIILAHVLR
jgi:sulfur carrier protein ThiS adenylyltransferase